MSNTKELASQNVTERINAVETANAEQCKQEDMKIEEKLPKGAVEIENAATSASEEQTIAGTPVEVEGCGCPEEAPKTWKAVINGEEQEVIIAFSDFNMELPKKKEDLFKLVEKENLLPVMYNLTLPEIFWKENYTLKDCEGNVIENGTPNVYVLCPEPETSCRIFYDEVLKDVTVHTFGSVQEWAKAVGTTNQLSLSFNKVKEVGVAAVAVGDEAAKEIFAFAKKNKVNNTIAEIYLDTRLTPQTVSKMMLGHKPKMALSLGRTPEEAQKLYEQCRLTFGEGETKKRYVGRAVSSILKQEKYSLELVLDALKTIPASDVTHAKLMECGAKEACIIGVLISWMIEIQRQGTAKAAA